MGRMRGRLRERRGTGRGAEKAPEKHSCTLCVAQMASSCTVARFEVSHNCLLHTIVFYTVAQI